MHKLTAGSGYDYLTRQVAALDATDKGHVGLADYYTARGESAGRWAGAGMDGIDGLTAGDAVTADQMRNLFGAGLHPLANQQAADLDDEGGAKASEAVGRLGAPFKVFKNDISPFRIAVAQRLKEVNQAEGQPAGSPVPTEVRAQIRTEVAKEFFKAEQGRDPFDARELAGAIAKLSRPKARAVAGFDLTFSPVKSVSTLWAVADPRTAAAIEAAHHAAVSDALRFIEQHALFTRTGADGIRQVNVRGLVAATFVHRDSRAGDPDLHTHVAVANKVQTLDGRWRAIDGRVLYKAKVSASETYNTALEAHLTQRLGVSFAERPNADRRKRPVREIVGVDQRLNARWSARRMEINSRRAELAARFQHDHGRPPTPVEAIQLAQQATLETRNAKHEPRSLAEQRTTWRAQAAEVLGSDARITAMVDQAIHPGRTTAPLATPEWLDQAAVRGLAQVESHRSTWRVWHVRAEALRQVRELGLPADRVDAMVDRLTTEILQRHSVALTGPDDGITEPAMLRRSDGTSVYTVAGSALYTSATVLEAERRLVETAGRSDGRAVPAASVDVALLELIANGAELDAGQADLVRDMASSGARLQLAIAPAGAGKTTAMAALARVWAADGGRLVGLAPSAAAAAQLRDQIEAPTDTLAKLVWSIEHGDPPDWAQRIGHDTLAIIDEAGMADTPTLDAAVAFITGQGGSVRLIGDDQQLAAIGAGGVIRDIATTYGAVRLSELHRFTNRAEAAASLALREGRPEALGFYLDHRRIHVGDLTTATDQLFNAWKNDRERGLDAIMLAPTRELVAELNCRARTDRVGVANAVARTTPVGSTVTLADGNLAGADDMIITRRNDRRLRVGGSGWVKNGDRWSVRAVHPDGSLTVRHLKHRRSIRLPADFVADHVELGYATTVHAAQGVTADVMHGLVSGDEARQQLYTMATRGRQANHLYLVIVGDGDPHSAIGPDLVHPKTAIDTLETILARDSGSMSAASSARDLQDPAVRLGDAAARYLDALHVAATDHAGPELIDRLDAIAEHLASGLTDEPAWPTLRARLLLLHAHGHNPERLLTAAVGVWELESAGDPAAVLERRLPAIDHPGPLPWLPGIPSQLATHPDWGPYLTEREQLVTDLADQVRGQCPDRPHWVPQGAAPPRQLVEQVEVWRSATSIEPADRRPTGPTQYGGTLADWQVRLDGALAAGHVPAVETWGPAIAAAGRSAATDPFLPALADRLTGLSDAGMDATDLLSKAINVQPLPDEHGAAALWWRIHDHLSSADAYFAELGGLVRPDEPTPLDHASAADPATRWRHLVDQLDPRIAQQSDWGALAAALQRGHDQGHDMQAVTRALVGRRPLSSLPAQDLRYRLATVIRPDTSPTTDEPRRRHKPTLIPIQARSPEPPRR